MKRRKFIKVTAGSTAALSLSSLLSKCSSSIKRPNIIFIMSDDHAANALSCYGSKINKTPHLDRLAAEGMRFDNCFCTNSICTPSRASILTGKYSHKNGVLTLDVPLDSSQLTFPKLLQEAGYYTGVVGKWHLSGYHQQPRGKRDLKPEPAGFDYWNVLPGQGGYFDPDMVEMGKWKQYKGYVTDIITDIALDFLENRPKDKPFCLLYQHKAPHDYFDYDEKHAHLYEDMSIPEPETFFDDYRNKGEAIKRTTQKIGTKHTLWLLKNRSGLTEEEIKKLSPEELKKQAYQVYIKSYLRCVASIDDNVGRLLDYLDGKGLNENTIIVYTSDQGMFLGEHGLFDKRFMYEESLRVPFIVRYPKEIKKDTVNKDIVIQEDFAETFLDFAGLPIPGDMQGRSLRPLFKEKTPRDWRRSMYYRYWMHLPHFRVAAHFGVRTERYKLIYYYGQALNAPGAVDEPTPPEWELFDLEKDPKEMMNLYGKSGYENITLELKKELIRLRNELGDDQDGITINTTSASIKKNA
jgi:arylsulfatase A-like enzyme